VSKPSFVDPRRILVVKRDKVGDLLLATPMLAALRAAFPLARIDVVASDYNAWVLDGNRDVDAVHAYPRARMGRRVRAAAVVDQALLALRLRGARYDVAIAANGEDSSQATRRARWAGARRTIAYAGGTDPVGGDVLAPPAQGHERDRMLGLLRPLGIEVARPAWPRWRPDEASLGEARAWLAAERLSPGGYIVVGLGARRAKKQPTAEQVIAWSHAAHAKHGLATVFMWTPGPGDNPLYPGDDEAAGAVLARRPAHLHPFRGPLKPAAALAWLAARSIFPDSGLMHLAAASPGGVVGLFADTAVSPPPSRWSPLGPRASWLEAPQAVAELADEAVLAALFEARSVDSLAA
jgi:ADP-heptose:LPS heptosyltransferase